MTKQDLIKKAYGDHYEVLKSHIDENGWDTDLKFYEIDHKRFDYEVKGHGIYITRPIELKGIEHNNSWKRIEDKEKMKGNDTIDIVYTDKGNIYSYATFCNFSSIHELENITHSQQLQKPKPPIY